MDQVTIEDAMMELLNHSKIISKERGEAKKDVSSYFEAAEALSHKIESQNATSGDKLLRDFSNVGSDLLSSSHNYLVMNNSNFTNNQTGQHPNPSEDDDFRLQVQDEMEWQGPSSGQPATFTTRGQARRGSSHGKGGRLPGSGAQVRKYYSKYTRSALRQRMYSLLTILSSSPASNGNNLSNRFDSSAESGCQKEDVMIAAKIAEEVISYKDQFNLDIADHSPEGIKEKLIQELKKSASDEYPISVEILPFCTLGVTVRFSKSDSVQPREGKGFNVRERHIVNTWLDKNGHVRCTCIGSTQYELFALTKEFHYPCCIHADAFVDTLKELSRSVFGNEGIPLEVYYNAFAVVQPEILDEESITLPLYRRTHRNNTVVFVCNDICGDDQLCWVPVRKVQRGGGRYLCAFCDMINTNSCHHVAELRKLCMEDVEIQTEGILSDGDHSQEGSSPHGNGNETEETPWFKNHQPVSTLPVGPVNCPVALRVDQEICELLKRNGVFKLKAPTLCTYCESPRIESTRSENTSGVVICSLGACRMEIVTYICSVCRKQFSAEGMREGVFIDSVCLAATHKLLRDQLIGFALGNGTLASRLDQFHSQVTAFEDAKLFQSQLPCRSTRRLYDLCISFVRLMVCDPQTSLFFCPTCQGGNEPSTDGKESYKVPRAICVDGIWAGYLKKTAIPFENVSEPCKPVDSFSRSTMKPSLHKPHTRFLRLDKTVTFLLTAVKGKSLEVNCGSINALVAAVRLVDEIVLPNDFYNTSVCGAFPLDYKYDIAGGWLSRLRGLTCQLFHKNTLLYRMIEPLQRLFQRQGKRRKCSKRTSKAIDYSDAYDVVSSCITRITTLSQDEEGVCWNEKVRTAMNKGDIGMKIFQLFQALLQGPITHLIRREELSSATELANASIHFEIDDFMKAMVRKTFANFEIENLAGEQKGSDDGANIAKNVRLFEGGLISAAAIDKGAIEQSTRGSTLLPAFGHVILCAVELASQFYSFYDQHVRNSGSEAAEYAKRWGSHNFDILRDRFLKLSKSVRFQPSWGADYDDPFVTGAYFPSLPQVRPLPFNEGKASKTIDFEVAFGFCSKHYLQRNASFTPGALTFSCSCAHPIVLGFKVLEKDEGPRAVLDVLLSRFPELPRFIIYDFACGVYRSAINTLWWVVENSTLVSDSFHANNHTCSPAFQPTAQVNLNMVNTLSHEQRNRPIAKIKGSLQQTSQDVYISLLAYQITINNIEAKGRTAGEAQQPLRNRSAKDIEWSFFHRLHLSCPCCVSRRDDNTLSSLKSE